MIDWIDSKILKAFCNFLLKVKLYFYFMHLGVLSMCVQCPKRSERTSDLERSNRHMWASMNLEAGADRGHWGTLLTGLLSLPSYRTQDHQPRGALPTVGWVLPIHHPWRCRPRRQAAAGIISVEVSSSKMTLACVKLTKTQKRWCLPRFKKCKIGSSDTCL